METVEISKCNESFIRLNASASVQREIAAHFTHKMSGWQYTPAGKNKLWNGDVHFYNAKTHQLPLGLYSKLSEYCKHNDLQLVFNANEEYSRIIDTPDVDYEDVVEFVDSLKISNANGLLQVRDYQYDAIYQCIKNKRMTAISPTASGKSMIIYAIIRWMLEHNPESKILLLVPQTQLVNQMWSDFDEYSLQNGWRIEDHCQKLYSGKSKELKSQVLITTWQSFNPLLKDKTQSAEILQSYTSIIVDEAHTSKGNVLKTILERSIHADYRLGFTGTIDQRPEAKISALTVEGGLGPVYVVTTTKQLILDGSVSELHIKAIVVKYPTEKAELIHRASYQDEIEWLVTNNKRNAYLMSLAKNLSGTTIMLFNKRDTHAKLIYSALLKSATKPVYYIAGDVKVTDRELIRLQANSEDCIIVATYATCSTGINIPGIENVMFCSPSKSYTRVLQSIGRGLRLRSGKTACKLYDIIDDLRLVVNDKETNRNYAYLHGLERLSIYKHQKFDISFGSYQL